MNSPAGAGGSSPLGSWVSTLPSPLLPGWMLPCEQQPRVGKKDGGELFPVAIPEKSSRSRYFDPKMFGVFPPPPFCYRDWLQVSTEQTQKKLQLLQSMCPRAEYSGTGISL